MPGERARIGFEKIKKKKKKKRRRTELKMGGHHEEIQRPTIRKEGKPK